MTSCRAIAWDEDDLDLRTAWRVVQPARVALLDESFARQACRRPGVVAELMQRAGAVQRRYRARSA